MPASDPIPARHPDPDAFSIRFPSDENGLEQNEEWFECILDDQRQRLRIHDYATLFSEPGLYEALVYRKLACSSPAVLGQLFAETLAATDVAPDTLRVLDLGAGNGMVAEEIRKAGASHVVGLDLIPEARDAAERDRPDTYADYLVADLCDLEEKDRQQLDEHKLNCLVTVAALGFGDIPPLAFAEAFNALTWEGWLGMTIKEDFLDTEDDSGFAGLIRSMLDQKIIEVMSRKRYRHRQSITGEPIYYVALVARKHRDIPAGLLNREQQNNSQAA